MKGVAPEVEVGQQKMVQEEPLIEVEAVVVERSSEAKGVEEVRCLSEVKVQDE